MHYECRLKQVDRLFSHVWHYFDTIVVEDRIAQDLASEWNGDANTLHDDFFAQLKVLLYLRSIGTENLIEILVRQHIAHLGTDLGASMKYRAALGCVHPFLQAILQEQKPITSEDVLMNIRLPIIDGLSTQALLRIRVEEAEYFLRFEML